MPTNILYEYKSIKNELSADEAKSLESFLLKNGLDKALKITPHNITAANYVGVIKYKKYQFEILPKLLAKDNQNNTSILKNLFFMLSYTKKLEIKQTELAKMTESQNPFLEILISHYANTLYDLYLRCIPKNYIVQDENLNFLKGKLNFSEHIRRNNSNQAKFQCKYDEFCEDTLLNQMFLFVTTMLKKITQSPNNRKKLKLIETILSEVSFKQITYQQVKSLSLTRNQECFFQPFRLAKMFLQNASIEMSSRKFSTISILFDMNELFEEFIYRFIDKNKGAINPQIKSVSYQKGKRLIKNVENLIDNNLSENKLGNTYLDMFIEFIDYRKVIIDTKYKLHDGEKNYFSNSDIFQMVTYENIHDTKFAILLYPQNTDEKFAWKHTLNSEQENYVISTCIDLRDDLSISQEIIKNRLTEILNYTPN